MTSDSKSIKKLIKLMQKEGVLRLKTPEIELELSNAAVFKDEPVRSSPEEESPKETKYTDLDIAMWSAPGSADFPSS